MTQLFSNLSKITLEELKKCSPNLVRIIYPYSTTMDYFGVLLKEIKDSFLETERVMATWGFLVRDPNIFRIEFDSHLQTRLNEFENIEWEAVLKGKFCRNRNINQIFFSYLTHPDPVVRYFVKSIILPLIQSNNE